MTSSVGFHQLAPHIRLVQRIEADDRYRVPPRMIYDHEIIYVLQGVCVYDIDGQEVELRAGDLHVMKPYVLHSCRVPAGDTFRYYAVHFDYVHMGDQYDFPVEEVYLNQDYARAAEIPVIGELTERPAVVMTEPELPYVTRTGGLFPYEYHFEELYRAYESRQYGYELAMRASLLHILTALVRERRNDSGVRTDHPQLERVQKAIHFMNTHYREQLDTDAIARSVFLSAGHFRTLFREATGKTPLEYLTQIRMDNAKRLLRQGRETIGAVAEKTGYPDLHYFSKLFKRLEGLSPRQYADTLRKFGE